MGAGGIVLIIVVILALIGIAWLLFWWLYERASKEMSFVRTGLGGEKDRHEQRRTSFYRFCTTPPLST